MRRFFASFIFMYSASALAKPVAQTGTYMEAQSLPAITTTVSLTPSAPSAPAPIQAVAEEQKISAAAAGITIPDFPKVDRLTIPAEAKISASQFLLDSNSSKRLEQVAPQQLDSPVVMTGKELAPLVKSPELALPANPLQPYVFQPKGKVDRTQFERFVQLYQLKPEATLALQPFKPLTENETRFLSGLLLYQAGDRCATAIGLFYTLSKEQGYDAEASYYLAMCSKQMGLNTDFLERAARVLKTEDIYYAHKILKEIPFEVQHDFVPSLGEALVKISSNPKIVQYDDKLTAQNISYVLAAYASHVGQFKVSLPFAKKVPQGHPRYSEARFLEAVAEYAGGNKSLALDIQDKLIAQLSAAKNKNEFQALVALNLGRMYFQEKEFKQARENFLKVTKDHPLWMQSLTEMGWAQLQSGDYEGAIGNMYSIQSPFFNAVYKPESFVIRTIGYLNLCQYGDAYRALSKLEKEYRPWHLKMVEYIKSHPGHYYQTAKNFIKRKGDLPEFDGLPAPVVRELVRQKDFLNYQNALNRQLDEREIYGRLTDEVERSFKKAQGMVLNSRQRSADLRTQIEALRGQPAMQAKRDGMILRLRSELESLNHAFFQLDLYKEAKKTLTVYRAEVSAMADKRIAKMNGILEKILQTRLARLQDDLRQMLDNNELLRYEVFAGSGENLRYQVAGGEKGNRVPASAIPKTKALQWEFDGEYWEDEIGHYRSSLKNNCPETGGRSQAAADGGGQ